MSKKYIIILVIVIVAAVGVYLYQNYKKENDLRAHHIRQYKRIIEVARKSSIAGLSQMARALNNYNERNGAYPAELSALHPEFIPVKAFIDDLQWNYKPNKSDFYLSKTVTTKKGKVLTASIGPDLIPQEKSQTVAASAKAAKKATSRAISKSLEKSSETGISAAISPKPKSLTPISTPAVPSAGLKNPPGKSDDSTAPAILKNKLKPISGKKKLQPDMEKIRTRKLTKKEQFIHGVNQKFLVWKNADGSLGFSNIQYPTSPELTVYDQGEWIQISRRNWYAKTPKDIRQHKNK